MDQGIFSLFVSLTVPAAAIAPAAATAISWYSAAVAETFPLRGFLTWTPVGGEVENWTGVGPEEEEEGGREENELAEEEVSSAVVGVTAISWRSLQSWFSDTADEDELQNGSYIVR